MEGENAVYGERADHAPTAFDGFDCIVAALAMPAVRSS
jgi:hypothetical protein